MRNAARIKLGYYPLPVEEARNIRSLLVPSAPYPAIDPCVGDGTALVEITWNTGAHLAGIELDADRAAASTQNGIATVHGLGLAIARRLVQSAGAGVHSGWGYSGQSLHGEPGRCARRYGQLPGARQEK